VAGALHVHTRRSHDAVGTDSEVARAARAADLDFVLITDHRSRDAPADQWETPARYSDGVLLVRGQELSLGSDLGRVLVFGLDTVLTRWEDGLDAFARKLEDDTALAVVAHPRSPRRRDSWRPRETPGIVGWEVFDLTDVSRARLTSPWVAYHLLALAVTLPLGRAHQSLLRLHREGFDQPAVAAFDSLYARRPLTALGALDVHAKKRIAGRLFPPYRPFFKSVVNHVELPAPLAVDAGEAARALAAALTAGRAFISFGDARGARNFVLSVGARGDSLPSRGPRLGSRPGRLLRAGFVGGPRRRLVYRVFRDGTFLAWVRSAELAWPPSGPGAYRVEVYRYTLRLGPLYWNLRPWIFTNPVRLAGPAG
jgi:hypothetical protein